jgi:cysteinyl-tRNA synthetase
MAAGARVRLFNSMGRRAVDFAPLAEGRVRIYSCGPTVYSDPHLGNMRPYVFSDTIRRLLEWKGYSVTQVVNITDVGHVMGDRDEGEDKVEFAARKEQRLVKDITRGYAEAFFGFMADLNVLPATYYPYASDYVPQMIKFASRLEELGYTYQLPSGLYFDTARSGDYGKLALMPPTGQLEEGRVSLEGKRSAADFAVWRADPPGQQRIMRWESPWGWGVPGWHLECSVMSIDLLGEHFDIHTGGVDHREIHHVNEIAQSEAYLNDGQPWVPLWMHNEFLLLSGAKLSKSSGRMPTLRDLAETGYPPMAFRYFLLTAQYGKQLDLSNESLAAATAALRRLLLRIAPLRPLPAISRYDEAWNALGEPGRRALEALDEAWSNDLNTPQALAELQGILRSAELTDSDKAVLAAAANQVLGLRLDSLDPDEITERAGQLTVPAELVEELVAARSAAREAGNWAEADQLRDRLAGLGVQVTDTADGPRWTAAGTAGSGA